jgi:hypothetical protein
MLRDQRRGEARERLGHEHDVARLADRVDHCIGVRVPARAVIIRRQPHGDRLVAAGLELPGEQVPFPRVAAGARDQDERRHGTTSRIPEAYPRPSPDRACVPPFAAWRD